MAVSGWHVKASDLKSWTSRRKREAEDTLPLLIRKLVVASLHPQHISIPAGDSILIGGWDGVLQVKYGNAFVPDGWSAWEFGTSKNIKGKADSDYQKRSRRPLGLNKPNTTFMFATSCAFANRDKWQTSKNRRTTWKDVKALNADDLEAWLDQTPAVHRWFSRLIGKRPQGAWDLQKAWNEWRQITNPPCTTELLLGGRDNEIELLREQLAATPRVIRILGESFEDGYSFILAALEATQIFSPRVLIVTDVNEWDELIESQQPLILIPKFTQPRTFRLAAERGHHVLEAASGRLPSTGEEGIRLNKQNTQLLVNALKLMGLSVKNAETIVEQTRGSITVIRRNNLLSPGSVKFPDWANPDEADKIVPALLAGSWDRNKEADCQTLEQLSGLVYKDFETTLFGRAVQDDPPLHLVGNVWELISRSDAWYLLSKFVNAPVLDRLESSVIQVLGEIDPRFELEAEEQWLANIKGKTPKHSSRLRQGLAETLAMLGAYGTRDCTNTGPVNIQDRVNHWVHQLLVVGASKDRWRSLGGLLPQIAEATPEQFLQAVENDLIGESKHVMCLFEERGQFGGCNHAGLLWALETVSWNPTLLPQVTRILAKLTRMDPGGKYMNRPNASLKEIFQGWRPHTTLPLKDRMEILDGLITQEPEEAWHLLLKLLPRRSELSSGIHQPSYRSWAANWNPEVSQEQLSQHMEAVSKRLVTNVDAPGGTRWPEALENLINLPKKLLAEFIKKLKDANKGSMAADTKRQIVDGLRNLISRHRQFSDARWALPKEAVDQLEDVLQGFLPESIIEQKKYLFDDYHPPLLDTTAGDDFHAREQLITNMRNTAINEVWDSGGATEVEQLTRNAKFPELLGITLADAPFAADIEATVLGWLGTREETLARCLDTFIAKRFTNNEKWLEEVVKEYFGTWNNDQLVSFCLFLPFGRKTFNLLEKLDDKVAEGYWKQNKRFYLATEDADLTEWVLKKLLDVDRPIPVVGIGSHYLHITKQDSNIANEIFATALEKAAMSKEGIGENPSSSFTYSVEELIQHLQEASDVEQDRIARIEWTYLPVFRYSRVQPKTLIREVLKDPSWFVHLICLAFKPTPLESEENREKLIDEKKLGMARGAYDLLHLVGQIPGQNGDNVDSNSLINWVQRARHMCREKSRGEIGDQLIGEILSHSPIGADAVWPHEAVRNVLETEESPDLENGLEIGRENQRGVTTRAFDEGGLQERELVKQYEEQANLIQLTHPRTGALLLRMARHYARYADQEDREKDLRI